MELQKQRRPHRFLPSPTGALPLSSAQDARHGSSSDEIDVFDAQQRRKKKAKTLRLARVPRKVQRAQGFYAEACRELRRGDIVAIVGAGISTSAGLPDFRSTGGVFNHIRQTYQSISRPEDVFSLKHFLTEPGAFYAALRLLWPAQFLQPTKTHEMLAELHRLQLLRRIYTQNVDNLERAAGLPDHLVIRMHGHFETAKCMVCEARSDHSAVEDFIMNGTMPTCSQPGCNGVVKPDIVLYGEELPAEYRQQVKGDFSLCKGLLVIGTSLAANPAHRLVSSVSGEKPRIFIDRTMVQSAKRSRDIVLKGECDEVADNLLSTFDHS